MSKTILVATGNPAKKKLFNYIFNEIGFEPVFLDSLNLCNEKIIEDGKTPIENAFKKARHFHNLTKMVTYGDDVGLEIEALNGEPGVEARRWNGVFKDNVDDEIWLEYLLKRMEGIPLEKRTGKFVSGWAIVDSEGVEYTKKFENRFLILEKPLRPYIKGWPMSGVQYDVEYNAMFKDLPEEVQFKRILNGFKEWDLKSFLKL